MQFLPFPKLARLNREIVITEKLDGTNAQVFIAERCTCTPTTGIFSGCSGCPNSELVIAEKDNLLLFAGSRTKWITPGKQTDNYGFAQWVKDNAEELFKLGPGQHFGEWWGGKIQRGYGLTEKRFSLFNVSRWIDRHAWPKETETSFLPNQQWAPTCCHVVPTLYQGIFSEGAIHLSLEGLRIGGSVAAPGFMKPEGIVIFHTANNTMFKVTLEGDEKPKSLAA